LSNTTQVVHIYVIRYNCYYPLHCEGNKSLLVTKVATQ